MKNLFLSVSFIIATTFTACGQNYYLAAPEGYGAGTTGGGNATPEIATTFTELKSKMLASGAKVILVSGEITIPSGQPISAIITNKTIIGLPGAKLINENQSNPGAGIFYLKNGSNNVIIRNLIFVGPGAYDIDGQDNMTADGCIKLWVDHCEFQDGQDGNFDIKGNSDNVSVSWCKFTYLKPAVPGGSGGSNDHRFSDLVGSSASNAPADGHYSITFQNCYWANGCKERMPRARNAELHLLSCYYNTTVSSAKAIGLGGGINNSTCYVENTNFANIANVYTYYSSDGGTAAVNFTNCLNGVANIGTVNAPTYTATAIPVDLVEGYLTDATCGAGATLQVTSGGVITPSACTTMVTEVIGSGALLDFYPTLVEDTLKIDTSHFTNGEVSLNVFAENGQKVLSFSKTITPGESLDISVDRLSRGTYICVLQNNKKAINWKFVKK